MVVTAMIASRLQANLKCGIITTTRFPKEIQKDISRLGVDVENALQSRMFRIADWYTCITGRVPADLPDDMPASLKIEELGLLTSKYWHTGKGLSPDSDPEFIEFAVFDNLTRLFNYNEGNVCFKFLNTMLARLKQDTRTVVCGFATGVLEKKDYSNLESMFDGVVDVDTIEAGGGIHTIVRVRSFPDVKHRKGWYTVRSLPDGVSLMPISQMGPEAQRAASSFVNTPQG